MTLHASLLASHAHEHEDAAVVASVSHSIPPCPPTHTLSTHVLLRLHRQLWLIASLASACIAAFGLGRFTAPELAQPATALQHNEPAGQAWQALGQPAAPERSDHSPQPYPTGAQPQDTPLSNPDAAPSPHRVDDIPTSEVSEGTETRSARLQTRSPVLQRRGEQVHAAQAVTMPRTQAEAPLRDATHSGHGSAIELLAPRDPYMYESAIRAVLETQPDSLPALSALATHLAAQQRWEEARQTFERALHLAPTSADLLFNAAVCADHLGRRSSARELYTRALDAAGIETATFRMEDARQRINALDQEWASP